MEQATLDVRTLPLPAGDSSPFDVSIIIVNWNGRALLRDLLMSIDRHAGDLQVQTIVVDNASVDASAEMVVEEFPHVTLVLCLENVGFARGNNRGAAAATGRDLFFLNNDTALRPGALQTLVDFLRENADAVAVGPKLIGTDGKPQASARRLLTFTAAMHRITFIRAIQIFEPAYRRYRSREFDASQTTRVGQLAGAALLVRRSVFEQIGGWDEGFEFGGEDIDLCKRLSAVGSIWYVADSVIEHAGRISTRGNRPYAYRTYECGYARYLAKHSGRASGVMYKVLVTIDMPIRIAELCVKWVVARVTGQVDKADKTAEFLQAASQFFRYGLVAFWRA